MFLSFPFQIPKHYQGLLKEKNGQVIYIEEGILETKTDCSGKDQLFYACVAFWVITFEPIMI